MYKYFRGQKAFELYLECLQLILRHQVWYLIHDKGLPTELEITVFDLWALRVAQLENKVADATEYDSQSQAFTTDESGTENETDMFRSASRKAKLKGMPSLADALALCYMGTLTLRLPVTPGDIYEWATNDKLPYLRAIKFVPASMKERLPARYHAYLDPNGLLQFHRFYTALVGLETSLSNEHGITWPALNQPLLLFRYLKELALPLEVYDVTTRLVRFLQYDLIPPVTGKSRLGIRHLPEAQLISCLVIGVKLLYPFDDLEWHPRTVTEPAATRMNWEEWHNHMSTYRMESRGPTLKYTKEEFVLLQEKDVFSMNENQLDQYLDWYHDAFIDEDRLARGEDGEFRHALYEMFPIAKNQSQQRAEESPHQSALSTEIEVVKAVHSSVRPRRARPDEAMKDGTRRPGQIYAIYRTLQDVPDQARPFYEEAAKIAGLSMDMLIQSVFFTERKIEKRRQDEKRQSTGPFIRDVG